MANPEFTVKQFAAREQVTERTVRNWIDKGAIHTRRTPGGGIRIRDDRKTAENRRNASN